MEVTPIIVDPTYYSRSRSNNWNLFGPYEYNGALFLVYGGGHLYGEYAIVWKSTNYGTTWTLLDGPGPSYGNSFAVDYRGGTTLYVVTPAFGTYYLQVAEFDLATESWGATATSAIDGSTGDITIAARADGSRLIVYGYNNRTYYVVYDGSWGSPVEVSDDVNPAYYANFRCAIRDTSDTVHVIYRPYQPGGLGLKEYHYRQISSAGVMSTPQTLPGTYVNRIFGFPTFWGTKLVFPHRYVSGLSSLRVYVADPYTDPAPSWSEETVFSSGVANVVENGCIVDQAGDLWAYWILLAMGTVDAIYRSKREAGGWSAAEIIHDEIAFPTNSQPPAMQYLHELSVRALSGTAIGIGTALEWGSECVGYHLFWGIPVPPPSVVTECVPVICKKPTEIVDVPLNWAPWLPSNDAVDTSTWTVPSGLTLTSSSKTSTLTTARISAGTVNNDYVIQNVVATQEGRTEHRCVLVRVRSL